MRRRIAFGRLKLARKLGTCDRNLHAPELAARAAALFHA
jgi:hypothetical protein